ncbi:MAG: helix-turn-helix domain-containing protein [Candidatus Heimdallarchaeaceae archaeon]
MSFVDRLNLTPEEKKVYQLLLGAGQLTAFEISQFAQLHHSKVQLALDGLKTKGAIGISEGYVQKYYVRIPLDYLAQTSDQITEKIKSNLEETTSFIQEKKNSFENTRTTLISKLNDGIANKEQWLEQQSNQHSSELQSIAQQKEEFISQKISSFKNSILELEETKRQELIEALRNFQQNNIEGFNQAKTTLNTITDIIYRKSQENSTNLNSQMEQKTEQAVGQIQEISELIKPKLEELSSEFSSNLESIVESIRQNIDLTKIDVKSFNKAQVDKYIAYSEKTTKKTGETIDGISDSISQSLSELNSSLEMVLNGKVEELSLQIQEAINALNEKITSIKNSLVEELLQRKTAVINSAISQVKETMMIKYTDLQNNEQNQKNDIISERDIFSQKLDTYYQEAINSYEQKISEIKENMILRFNEFTNSLSSKFQETTTSIANQLNEQIKVFKEFSAQLNSLLSEELSVGSSQLKEKWDDLIEKAQTLTQENESTIQKYQEDINSKLQSTADQMVEELSKFVSETKNSALSILNSLVSTSKSALKEGQELVTGSLNDEIIASSSFIEDTGKKFVDTANFLISSTMKLKNDFRTLEATSKEVQIPPVQTSSIIGLEATLEHLARITENAKRSVTILAPKKDYIPVEVIKKLPTTVKVTVVTKLDEELDSEWINNLASAQANVEIRKFRGMGTGVELPKFIGAERENEEVLIAAEDEATKQVVGIISKSTYFASLVSYIVISDFARGRSTQVK